MISMLTTYLSSWHSENTLTEWFYQMQSQHHPDWTHQSLHSFDETATTQYINFYCNTKFILYNTGPVEHFNITFTTSNTMLLVPHYVLYEVPFGLLYSLLFYKKQCGQFLRVQDLKSGGRGFKNCSDHYAWTFSVDPSLTPQPCL